MAEGDSSTTRCNGRAAFLVCVVQGWTGAWQESILQQWQWQSTYFSSTGLIKSVVKPHWLTGIAEDSTAQQGHRRPNPCSVKIWIISRGKQIYKHFLLVTENKRKYGLEKMNAIFIVSGFWISLNKFTSSNSHKKMKWDYVNGWLLEKDLSKGLVFFVSNTIFSHSTFWERREKGYCAFHVPWSLCHSFCLNYTTGLHFVAISGF